MAKGERQRRPRGGKRPPVVLQDAPKIEADAVYAAESFSLITGLGRSAILNAMEHGLTTYKVSGRLFISGRAFHSYLDEQARKAAEGAAGRETPAASAG